MLNKEGDRGNQHLLTTQLQSVPDGLLPLLEDLRNRGASDRRFLPAIQWVLYALRPLTPEELHSAILASLGEVADETAFWTQQKIDAGMIHDFILSSSKGLLEIGFEEETSYDTINDPFSDDGFSTDAWSDSDYGFPPGTPVDPGTPVENSHGRVQFIHEVVREYFMGTAGFGIGSDVPYYREAQMDLALHRGVQRAAGLKKPAVCAVASRSEPRLEPSDRSARNGFFRFNRLDLRSL